MYHLGCTSDKIWDYTGLVQHLVETQDKDLSILIEPEAICLNNLGLYDILDSFSFRSVSIYTYNPLEQHPTYTINYSPLDFWITNRDPNISLDDLHKWSGKKKFMCLYGRPTAGRLGVGSYVKQHYQDDAHIHYSFPVVDNEYNFELDKLLSYRVESIGEVGEVLPLMPLILEPTDWYTAFNGYDYADPLTSYYKDIFVDLVVESHVAGKTFFPTEKIFRPMWLKKPFITFASQDFNEYLIQMGFKTFWEYWDEGYDGFEGKDRFNMILSLIDTIASKSTQELQQMYNSMQDVLDHNYNVLLNKSYNTDITEVV
jgi:hypothetical protein